MHRSGLSGGGPGWSSGAVRAGDRSGGELALAGLEENPATGKARIDAKTRVQCRGFYTYEK